MFCPKCGNSISDTAKFCGMCGHKFEIAEKSGMKYVRTLKKKKVVMPLLGCCILLGLFFLFSNALRQRRKYLGIMTACKV